MKINVLNEKLNVDPERVIEVTKERFYFLFFRMLYLKYDKTLSDNEIKVLSALCSNRTLQDTGISKTNLPPVLKKLNEKGLMDNKDLSEYTKRLKEKFKGDVEIMFKFKIIDDDYRSDNRDGA